MQRKTFFVTGTDTNVGKTLVSAGLLTAAKARGYSTLGLKPLAAGCEMTSSGLRNADALLLQSASTHVLSYEQINPIALQSAIAPHIAAQQEKRQLTADRLAGFCRGSLSLADVTLIEGAGGWHVPLNTQETLADMVRILRIPVILVVGVKLGCINHALLTQEAIRHDGLVLAGWVANCIDPDMAAGAENIHALAERLAAPCIGVVPWLEQVSTEAVAAVLSEENFLQVLLS